MLLGWGVSLAGLPIGLWWLQRVLVDNTDWRMIIAEPLTPVTLLFALVGFGWVVWLWLITATVYDVVAVVKDRPLRRLPASLSGLAGSLAGVIAALGEPSAASAAPAAPPPSVVAGLDPMAWTAHSTGSTSTPAHSRSVPAATEPVHVAASTVPAAQRHSNQGPTVTYQVRRGDWLGAISDRYLGDFDRYPELQRLNPGLIPNATGRHGPDHIESGWRLVLPADAHDRGARPHASGTGATTDAGSGAQPDTARTGEPPPAVTDGLHTNPPAPPAPTVPARPAGTATGADATTRDHADGTGIGGQLRDDWLAVPAVAAIVTALWWRRRRRLASGSSDRHTHRSSSRRPARPVGHGPAATGEGQPAGSAPAPCDAEHDGEGSDIDVPGGATASSAVRARVLTGQAVEDSARGLLVAALATTDAGQPGAEVVVPADTLAALFPDRSEQLAALPHLHVTGSVPEALAVLETIVIERSRRRDEDDDPDDRICARPDTDDGPVLLLTHAPMPGHDTRLQAVLHLGAALQISAVIIGSWPHSSAAAVVPGPAARAARPLDAPTALRHLLGAAAAHVPSDQVAVAAPATPVSGPGPTSAPLEHTTAQPPPPPLATPADPPDRPAGTPDVTRDGRAMASATRAALPVPGEQSSTDTALTLPVSVRVLGEPVILHRDGRPATGVRSHARELLVYLAVHRDGANLTDIMEALWPDATLRRAAERLSTETAHLRRHIRDAAGQPRQHPPGPAPRRIEPVVNTGGRYHLNPDIVTVDLWRLDDALRDATNTDPAVQLAHLHTAAEVPAGMLAAGHDYTWIDEAREHTRRQSIRARVRLAEHLAPTDPHRAAQLLQAAADLDPLHEALAQRAMRALAAAGDTAAVTHRLHQLRTGLATIGEQPSADTIALAAALSPPPTP
ncbi:BTAD domain-containing putative transcriptional regulator [Dactylosporangium matsuzakiense]|uniref:LysM domain-containing protein n=1 Tax=Dactylosporangium matsuzakiense TaxID=53360 RepID=A0A9W6NT09_9ACTN|nr:BTAD domain-containing putative transcriptional regulator [Dactylosporangium matsuzakiense]GLL08023.1 hypothetical protein GCM10017581_097830 [Dactylosporangium matsuzakiense]